MKGILRGLVVALAVALAGAKAAAAQDLAGRVVGLSDGDTVTALTAEKRQVRVRLSGIDAPESGQPYGTRARQELSALVFGRDVRVVGGEADRYGRTLGRVLVDGRDANAEMVRRGAAWVYRQYSRDIPLLGLEAEARDEPRRRFIGGACGRCRKRNGCRRGNGAPPAVRTVLRAVEPPRRLPPHPPGFPHRAARRLPPASLRGEAHLRPDGGLRRGAVPLRAVRPVAPGRGPRRRALRAPVPVTEAFDPDVRSSTAV